MTDLLRTPAEAERGSRHAPPRRVSNPPHPADGMTVHVDCGDGAVMTIADPRSYGGLLDESQGPVWTMTYGDPTSIRYTVASLLESYDYLLSSEITMAEATARLRLMRRTRLACFRARVAGQDGAG